MSRREKKGDDSEMAGREKWEQAEAARVEREKAMPPGILLTAVATSTSAEAPTEHWTPASALSGPTGTVVSLVFAADGQLLITGDADDTTIIWDLTDSTQPARIACLTSRDTGTRTTAQNLAATVPPASGARHRDQPGGPRPRRSLHAGHRQPRRGMAVSSNAHLLAEGHRDGTTTVWHLADPTAPVRSAVLHPAERRSGSANALAFSPDGPLLAIGYECGVAVLWDLSDPTRPIRRWTLLRRWGWRSEIFTVVFSPDQRTLAMGGFREGRRPAILWDLTGTRPARAAALRPPLGGFPSFTEFRPSVFSVAYSPDARLAAIAADQRSQVPATNYSPSGPERHDSMVILWDLTNPRRPRLTATLTQRGGDRNLPRHIMRRHEATTYTGHAATARAVAFSPDGHLLATGSDDGTAILWDLTNPSQPRPTTLVHPGHVRTLAFTPDGRQLVTGGGSGVALWDIP
jgi:WD40 repeat protein